MIGRTISHYRIISKLGEGGMGVVYKAEDTKLARVVAIKLLSPTALQGEEARARFVHEARVAASVNHPNICTIYEIDEYEGRPFIVMEFVDGRSLASVIESGPMVLERVRDIASQLSAGLQHAHDKGIVHRDIKPSNIMITPAGLAKIMDFGLARAADQTRLTREGTTVGTVAYMSPEQVRAEEVDRRTDLWSLGVILYEMVSGRRPFKGDYEQVVMYSILNDDPPPLTSLRTGVPLELERMVAKALAKQPAERYQHADELLSDLRRLNGAMSEAGSKPRTAGPGTMGEPVRKSGGTGLDGASPPGAARRRRRIALPISALVVAGLAVSYILLRPMITEQRLSASPRPIAVISFENLTGDPQYDYLSTAIPNLLITSLEQSGYLRVATWERLHDLMKQLGKGDTGPIDKEVGFELCRQGGIDLIVTGSFTKAGNTFATDVKVLDVGSKELVRTASARGDGVESILRRQVDVLSKEISRGVGLSLSRIEETQRPTIDVTTTSMEAFVHFLKGKDEFERFYYADARKELEEAVRIDSTFAVAHLYLALTLGALREPDAELAAYERARENSGRATDRERLYIESLYRANVEKDLPGSISLLKELVRRYPDEKNAHNALALRYFDTQQFRDATREFRKTLELDPSYAPAANSLAYAYLRAGDRERALETFRRYAALSPGDPNPFDSMGELYVVMGDIDKAVAEYRQALEVQPGFFGSARSVAYLYAVEEKYDSTLSFLDRYVKIAPSSMYAASGYFWQSLVLELLGDPDRAVETAEHALELSRSRLYPGGSPGACMFIMLVTYDTGRYNDIPRYRAALTTGQARFNVQMRGVADVYLRFISAMIRLKSGDHEGAVGALEETKRVVTGLPDDKSQISVFTRNLAILLEAEVLLDGGRPKEAIKVMSEHFRQPTPSMGEVTLILQNSPLDQDVVARSYAKLGDLDRAIAEYRALLDFNPKSNDRRLRNPRYRYRLAKLYEQKGRLPEAREEYGRFLALWKDADRRLPEYIDAVTRLERLGVAK